MVEGPKALNKEMLDSLPDDGPVVMVNLVRFRERSLVGQGSGWDAYSRYSKGDMPLLRKVGGTVLWAGHVQTAALGELASARWDWIVLVRYPSKAAFLEMMMSEEYERINTDRENGVAEHVILAADHQHSFQVSYRRRNTKYLNNC